MFQDAPFGIYRTSWQPYLPTRARSLATRSIDSESDEPKTFTTIGRHLIAKKLPPWIEWAAAKEMHFYIGDPPEQPVNRTDIDEIVYLGAAATFFIACELMAGRELYEQDANWFGPMRELHPYILQRQDRSAETQLSDLPVPEKFRSIFRDWANAKVDLVRRSSD
jgi:hypothetical protein